MKNLNYIIVNGYVSTGSSAVIDLIKEYGDVFVQGNEFRLFKDPHGLIDLDRNLNHPYDILNSDVAIRDYIEFIDRYCSEGGFFSSLKMNMNNIFNTDIKSLSLQYISHLVNSKYKGHWWYLDFNKSFLRYRIDRLLRRFKIRDWRKNSVMYFYYRNEKEFISITKNYISDLFSEILKNNSSSCSKVLLDQAIPPNLCSFAERYFDSYKIINVERDPRDVYVDLITEEKRNGDIVGHVGFDIAKTHNVDLFISWFKAQRFNKSQKSSKILEIHFEDLLLNFDVVSKIIVDFLELDESQHIKKGEFLNLDISRKNIGIWRQYDYVDEIIKIEKELKPYLYIK